MKRISLDEIRRRAESHPADWSRVDSKADAEIEADMRSDADWTDDIDVDWSTATVGLPPRKRSVSIRLDTDVLDHFRGMGPGYQTRINAVLRHYVESTTGRKATARRGSLPKTQT